MKKWFIWLIVIFFSNMLILFSAVTYYNIKIKKTNDSKVEIIDHSSELIEFEDEFVYMYSLELENHTKYDYFALIPVLSPDIIDHGNIGEVLDIKLIRYIDLKAGSHFITSGNFSLKKENFTEEQITMIKQKQEKIVTDYILGKKLHLEMGNKTD